jgi:hypothetical protein
LLCLDQPYALFHIELFAIAGGGKMNGAMDVPNAENRHIREAPTGKFAVANRLHNMKIIEMMLERVCRYPLHCYAVVRVGGDHCVAVPIVRVRQ